PNSRPATARGGVYWSGVDGRGSLLPRCSSSCRWRARRQTDPSQLEHASACLQTSFPSQSAAQMSGSLQDRFYNLTFVTQAAGKVFQEMWGTRVIRPLPDNIGRSPVDSCSSISLN